MKTPITHDSDRVTRLAVHLEREGYRLTRHRYGGRWFWWIDTDRQPQPIQGSGRIEQPYCSPAG